MRLKARWGSGGVGQEGLNEVILSFHFGYRWRRRGGEKHVKKSFHLSLNSQLSLSLSLSHEGTSTEREDDPFEERICLSQGPGRGGNYLLDVRPHAGKEDQAIGLSNALSPPPL